MTLSFERNGERPRRDTKCLKRIRRTFSAPVIVHMEARIRGLGRTTPVVARRERAVREACCCKVAANQNNHRCSVLVRARKYPTLSNVVPQEVREGELYLLNSVDSKRH